MYQYTASVYSANECASDRPLSLIESSTGHLYMPSSNLSSQSVVSHRTAGSINLEVSSVVQEPTELDNTSP